MIPGLRRSPGKGHGNPLQYSGLENSVDSRVHGIAKSQTQLSDFHFCYSPHWKMCVLVVQSYLTLCDLWTVAHQAPLSMEFSRQEYWSGWPFPSTGDLPDPGIKPRSPALQADSLLSELQGSLCNLMDCTLSGSSIHGILQARILEWVTIPFSRGSSQPRNQIWRSEEHTSELQSRE